MPSCACVVQSPPEFVPLVPVLPLDVPEAPLVPLLDSPLVPPLALVPLVPEEDVAPGSAGTFVESSLHATNATKRTKRPAPKDDVRRKRGERSIDSKWYQGS